MSRHDGRGARIRFEGGRACLVSPTSVPEGWLPAAFSVLSPGTERRHLQATVMGPPRMAGYMALAPAPPEGGWVLAGVPHGAAINPNGTDLLVCLAGVGVEVAAVARFQLMSALGFARTLTGSWREAPVWWGSSETDVPLPYSWAELDTITESMPLVRHFSAPDAALDGWALIFQDHYLEHSVGFVLGMHRSGVPAEWIFTLAKGDQTRNRHRIDATFRHLGFRSAVLDNAAINDPDTHRDTLTQSWRNWTPSSTLPTPSDAASWSSTTAGSWPAATVPPEHPGTWTPPSS